MSLKSNIGTSTVENIPVNSIRPNPYQPRKIFDSVAIEELANSIAEYGVIQPITVRALGKETYELVSGERRLRASIVAKFEKIPAIIVDINDDDSAVIALIENLQRRDLNFFEEAEGYYHLLTGHGFTQEELAKKLGKKQSTIANKTRLLKLSPQIKKLIMESGLTERHARALLKIPDDDIQLAILKRVIERNMNVSATEEYIETELNKFLAKKQLKTFATRKSGNKDYRIFLNTIKRALDMVKCAGIKAKTKQIEHPDYYEYIITINKD